MPKQTFTQEQMRLDGNEVYLIHIPRINYGFDGVGTQRFTHPMMFYNEMCNVLYSTASIEGIPQLERSKFVKPVDVDELAIHAIEYEKRLFDGDDWQKFDFFIKGHNANKNEFTREDVEFAIQLAFTNGRHAKVSQEEIETVIWQKLHPLSLPFSLTIEDNIITEVKWT